jgi:5'-methylthioadenosine phosphorylase
MKESRVSKKESVRLGIIGGSGLYQMKGLQNVQEYEVETPFGKPSAPIKLGRLEGQRVAFLARHGLGHHLLPAEVPYRANIYALKSMGVERVVSVNACGSLREDYAPGDIVVPDQIFDNTHGRPRTFFGEGLVAHAGVADPFCPLLSSDLSAALHRTGATVHSGGALVVIEGPRFSTRAESNVYRSWGMAIIGMTAAPEAFLAREAEMCYAVMGHVTDFDVWHISEAPVTVEMVIRILNQNTATAQQALQYLARDLRATVTCNCAQAMDSALITDPAVIPSATRKKLDLLVRKYLK